MWVLVIVYMLVSDAAAMDQRRARSDPMTEAACRAGLAILLDPGLPQVVPLGRAGSIVVLDARCELQNWRGLEGR